MLLNDGRDENTKLFIRSVYSANWKNWQDKIVREYKQHQDHNRNEAGEKKHKADGKCRGNIKPVTWKIQLDKSPYVEIILEYSNDIT